MVLNVIGALENIDKGKNSCFNILWLLIIFIIAYGSLIASASQHLCMLVYGNNFHRKEEFFTNCMASCTYML